METICITGVSGYVGTRLLERFDKDADIERIVGIDVKPPRLSSAKLAFYERDIRNSHAEIFNEHKPQSLIHLAFILNPIHDEKLMADINIGGTKSVMDAAGNAGVTHVTVAGSATAYGAHPDNPDILMEDAPLRGNKDFQYAYDKMILEKVCEEARQKYAQLSFCLLRPCVILGPNVSNYLSRFADLPVGFRVKGSNPPLQFVHEDDVGNLFYLASKNKISGAYNVAPDDAMTISEISQLFNRKLMDIPAGIAYPLARAMWALHISEAPAPYLHFFRYPWVLSNEKIKKALGYTFKYTTKETLVEFMKIKNNKIS